MQKTKPITLNMSDRLIDVLKNKPNSQELILTVNKICQNPELVTLEQFLAILNYVIPYFESLPVDTTRLVGLTVSQNFEFLTQLLNYPYDISLTVVIKSLILKIIKGHPDILNNYLQNGKLSKIQLSLIKSYFFGSKLYNYIHDQVSIDEYAEIIVTMFQNLITPGPNTHVLGEYLVAAVKLHPQLVSEAIFSDWVLKDKQSFQHNFIERFYQPSITLMKKKLNEVLFKFLGVYATKANLGSLKYVMDTVNPIFVDFTWITYSSTNILVQYIYITSLPERWLLRYINFLLVQWGVSNLNSRRLDSEDTTLTKLLGISVNSLSTQGKSQLVMNSAFTNAITQRLHNHNKDYINKTMHIAKLIVGADLKYDTPSVIEIPVYDYDTLSTTNCDLCLLGVPSVDLQDQLKTLNINDESDIDSDDELEEASNTRKIVFIKDLIKYFLQSRKSNDDPVIGLKLALDLIKSKKNIITELEYYSNELLDILIKLNNTYEKENFENLRIENIVAILQLVPKKIITIMELLFTKDLNLQQRMSLLSSIGLSAQALSNIDTNKTVTSIGHKAMQRVTPVNEGEVVWRSKKLQSGGPVTVINRFNAVAPLFFWPLANGWLDGIDLGTFDYLFKTHYLNTISMIFHLCKDHPNILNMEQAMALVLKQASDENVFTP